MDTILNGRVTPSCLVIETYSPGAEAMAEGLVVGHGPMPEFVFTEEEIDGMLAYLNSVQD
jgi:hypothetical protein